MPEVPTGGEPSSAGADGIGWRSSRKWVAARIDVGPGSQPISRNNPSGQIADSCVGRRTGLPHLVSPVSIAYLIGTGPTSCPSRDVRYDQNRGRQDLRSISNFNEYQFRGVVMTWY